MTQVCKDCVVCNFGLGNARNEMVKLILSFK